MGAGMNPFDLPGPQFLFFYAVFSVAVLLLASLATARAEGGDAPRLGFDDPYLLATLRGGVNEALRVAAVSLVDRGLLEAAGERLHTAREDAADLARRPIEKLLLRKFVTPGEAASIFDDAAAIDAGAVYGQTLVQLGLWPDAAAARMRNLRFTAAAAALLGMAGVKIAVALARGRHNVLFLVVEAAVATLLAFKATHPMCTAKGQALLADLRSMLAGLKERSGSIAPGGANNEAALLAAVFGLGALPAAEFAYAKRLYPKAADSTWSTSVCGASCGSSCGGGCGGGCGGCGG
jgi:uncharacterized protein (TIGR04222 family)